MTRLSMQNDWPTKKLGDICDFYSGLWKGKKPPYTNVGVIRNTNFTYDGNLDFFDVAYLPVEEKSFRNRKLFYGDIILEKSGGGPKQPVGRVAVFNKTVGDFSFSNFTSAIRVKNSCEVDFNFLHKFLLFSYESGITEKMQSNSTGIRNLDLHKYKEIQIPLPPLPTQLRIVKMLDEVLGGIEKAKVIAEGNAGRAREVFESYLAGVFEQKGEGWISEKIGDISRINYGYTEKSSFQNVGPKFLRITDIQDGSVDWDAVPFCKCDNEDIEKYRLQTGDIVFARTGATTGKSFLLDNPPVAVFASYLIRLQVLHKETILPELIYYFFQSSSYWEKIRLGTSGSTQGGFNAAKLADLAVSFPESRKDQLTLVAKLDALAGETRRLEGIYEGKVRALGELRRAVLAGAFAGDIENVEGQDSV